VSVSNSDVLGLAASPGVNVVRESVWVETAADKLLVVSLIHGEWSLDGVSGSSNSGNDLGRDGWHGGDIENLATLASVTVPVVVTVVVGWVNGGSGPEVLEKLGDEGHLARAQVLVAIVVVGDGAVTGQAHLGHVPSNVDVEVLSSSITDVAWVGVLAIEGSASVTSGEEVASVVKLVQDWSTTSSEGGEVAPATVAPDLGESDWNVALAWWAVIPDLTGLVVSSHATVGELVDDRLVDVLWHTVGLGLGAEGLNEASLNLTGVGGEHVVFVVPRVLTWRSLGAQGSRHCWRGQRGRVRQQISY